MKEKGWQSSWLNRARQSLAGAKGEFEQGRYDNAASRCYYAAFQAAVAVLIGAGTSPDRRGRWSHQVVWHRFEQYLEQNNANEILRGLLPALFGVRITADYANYGGVTRSDARISIQRTSQLVEMAEKAVKKADL